MDRLQNITNLESFYSTLSVKLDPLAHVKVLLAIIQSQVPFGG